MIKTNLNADTAPISGSIIPVPALGTPMAGGFFGGVSRDGTWIIVSPKAEGESVLAWKTTMTASPGAMSFVDGLANTRDIADADHPAAAFCAALRIGGFDDWHLGSLDDMQTLMRNLMPLSGGNPAQTAVEAFQEGGAEAFEATWHWTSTQDRPGYAWLQDFGDGHQDFYGKDFRTRVRAVRKCLPFTP
nr:DUF1566 domain-containing protein [Paramagnetospirillum magneticum]